MHRARVSRPSLESNRGSLLPTNHRLPGRLPLQTRPAQPIDHQCLAADFLLMVACRFQAYALPDFVCGLVVGVGVCLQKPSSEMLEEHSANWAQSEKMMRTKTRKRKQLRPVGMGVQGGVARRAETRAKGL